MTNEKEEKELHDSYVLLKQDLDRRITASESRAKSNYIVAYLVIALGVVSSSAATISVAAQALTPVGNAVIAAIPGICVMILNTFKFEARSRWWWRKNFRLIEIQAQLEHL